MDLSTFLRGIDDALAPIVPFVAVAGALPVFLFTVHYGFGTKRWWKTSLGIIMVTMFGCFGLLFALGIARRFFDAYPGYNLVATCVYGFLFLVLSAWYVAFLVERRRGSMELKVPIAKHATGEIPTQRPTSGHTRIHEDLGP